eukprot:jgi/Psemu1/4975/gm1.4975_g
MTRKNVGDDHRDWKWEAWTPCKEGKFRCTVANRNTLVEGASYCTYTVCAMRNAHSRTGISSEESHCKVLLALLQLEGHRVVLEHLFRDLGNTGNAGKAHENYFADNILGCL